MELASWLLPLNRGWIELDKVYITIQVGIKIVENKFQ